MGSREWEVGSGKWRGRPRPRLEHVEAQVTIAALLVSMTLMTALTARFGFSRILGFGHVAWLPLLAFLVARVAEVPATTGFGLWLRTVIVLDAISLVIDAADLVRFLRGDRAETVPSVEPSIGTGSRT